MANAFTNAAISFTNATIKNLSHTQFQLVILAKFWLVACNKITSQNFKGISSWNFLKPVTISTNL